MQKIAFGNYFVFLSEAIIIYILSIGKTYLNAPIWTQKVENP